jgi:hypothetical protein
LIIALITIGLGIVALIGFILLKKRRTPGGTKQDQTDDLLQSTEKVLATIDAKIKEKLQKYN